MFYLAESYRDAKCLDKALLSYEKRVSMGGWQEEVFWSLLQIAHLKKSLGFSEEDVIASYLKAHQYQPARSEPIYYLAELYNQSGRYALAYESIKNWQSRLKGDCQNVLFYLGWVDDYGIEFQLSIASFYLGQYEESLKLHDRLLENPRLPEVVRSQVIVNRLFPLRYLDEDTQHMCHASTF